MMALLDLLLALAAFIGHTAIAVYLFNRLHAISWPRPIVKLLDRLIVLLAALVVLVFIYRSVNEGCFAVDWRSGALDSQGLWLGYVALSWIAAVLVIPLWIVPKALSRVPAALVANDTRIVDLAQCVQHPVEGLSARLLMALPGNEVLKLHIQQKTLRLPRLPAELEGTTIAHLSDLHMTGDLTAGFYEQIVAETNALKPDLILITGDILEEHCCLPWGPKVLSKLRAKFGTYFILGNHEQRLQDVRPLRAALEKVGLIDVGGWSGRAMIYGNEVLLAGTELPWFGQAPDCPPPGEDGTFRILLSHSPDQIEWAKRHAFDLMLAGHNHGGQIRLPWLGALIVPSRYGCRYAAGVFDEPPTLLHVTRGISGDHLVRLNCPPELALLVLTR